MPSKNFQSSGLNFMSQCDLKIHDKFRNTNLKFSEPFLKVTKSRVECTFKSNNHAAIHKELKAVLSTCVFDVYFNILLKQLQLRNDGFKRDQTNSKVKFLNSWSWISKIT